MGVSLTKGGNVALTSEGLAKHDPALAGAISPQGLTRITVGLGWEARTTTGTDFDLDASAIAANTAGKVIGDKFFVYYNNTETPDQTIVHTGDNLTGDGEGDDEQIKVNLQGLPPEVDKVVFSVAIYDADNRQQNFGQVRKAYIRLVNDETGAELARYDLSEDAATETAMVFGELYRNGAEWKFRAIGQGHVSGLAGIAQDFGVTL